MSPILLCNRSLPVCCCLPIGGWDGRSGLAIGPSGRQQERGGLVPVNAVLSVIRALVLGPGDRQEASQKTGM